MSSEYEEEIVIPPVSRSSFAFPDPRKANDEGLLAYGGDLSPDRLLSAYRQGIFPWYSPEDPILWWSPNPRLVLYPEKFYVRKSFRRVLRNAEFTVTFDHAFDEVIERCAKIPRSGQAGSWIVPEMIEAYKELHRRGYAHSVEVYKDDKLMGGLYGVAIGKVFCGESMFSLTKDASKVAFKALSDVLAAKGYDFIDCQMPTDHMMSLGAEVIERDDFLDQLEKALKAPDEIGNWQNLEWTYEAYHKE